MTIDIPAVREVAIRCGEAVVVVAHEDGVLVRMADAQSGRHQSKVVAGDRLLVVPSRNATVRIEGRADCTAFDVTGATRLIAFLDHGRRLQRRRRASRTALLTALSREPIEEPAKAIAWVADAIVRGDPGVEVLAARWTRGETYHLVRFLLEQDEGIGIVALAERYGLSTAQFHRKCKRGLGKSLKLQLRLLRAGRSLLAYSGREYTFTRLAADNGYASASHFCAEIKALMGASPRKVYQAVTPDSP
jgi:AraC-like DNA-binding protein